MTTREISLTLTKEETESVMRKLTPIPSWLKVYVSLPQTSAFSQVLSSEVIEGDFMVLAEKKEKRF